MINLKNINLSFGDKVIFKDINVFIKEKSRIGIVGDNGAGKTTLLRAILGNVLLDNGSVEIQNKKTVAYLPQESTALPHTPIISYLKEKTEISNLENEKRRLEQLISTKQDELEQETLLKEYQHICERYEILNGYAFEARAMQILSGLGFKNEDKDKCCDEFSGGWKIRISLALILLKNPDIMLLDEPTNHLDTESMEWLEAWLKFYDGTLLTISHDKRFLDKTVTRIFEIFNGEITTYSGSFSNYEKEKVRRLEALKKEYEEQQAEIKKINEFIERFRYKASKASQVQSRVKMLEKFDLITIEENKKKVNIRFPETEKSGREVVKLKNVGKAYEDKRVFENVNLTIERDERIALVGVNGSGKTTLSKIAGQIIQPTEGEVDYGHKVSLTFFSQESFENLNYENTIWEEINNSKSKLTEAEKRSILGAFLFSGDDIYKKISVLSGGEKSRLSLLKVMLTEANFIILDEPTNHLDMKTKEIFHKALLEYDGTVLIVSHDRNFLDQLINRVIEIKDGGTKEYLGNYSYFIEKRDNEQPKQPETTENKKQEDKPSYKSKEQKRIEAEERNKLSKVKNKLKNTLEDIENKISEYEEEKTTCEEDLCKPEIISDSEKVVTLNKRLHELSEELTILYEEWEEVSVELESL